MNTGNFLNARTLRRNVVKLLQEQQSQDSKCSEQLRLVISRHTRTILTIVSELLLSFTEANITDQDRSLFLNLTRSSLTADSWLQSRAQENDAVVELARLNTLVTSAQAEYSRIAPLGRITGWVSVPQEKSQISAARVALARLRREYQNAESNHEVKLATLHQKAEHFLRHAMSSEGIAALVKESSVRTNLKIALDAMSKEISKLWLDHTRVRWFQGPPVYWLWQFWLGNWSQGPPNRHHRDYQRRSRRRFRPVRPPGGSRRTAELVQSDSRIRSTEIREPGHRIRYY